MHLYQKIIILLLVALLFFVVVCRAHQEKDTPGIDTPTHTEAVEEFTEAPESIEPTRAPTPEPTAKPLRYELTDAEREIIERVIMSEGRGEPYDGQRLIAQCILNTAEATGRRPDAVVLQPGQYAAPYSGEIYQSVKDAVTDVFDLGDMVTDRPVRYFYNPAKCVSEWHESLVFVIEFGAHRFFEVAP